MRHDDDNRVRPAVLLVLLAFLAVSGAVVYRIASDAFEDPGARSARAEPWVDPPRSRGEGEVPTYRHRDWGPESNGAPLAAPGDPAAAGRPGRVVPGPSNGPPDPQILAMRRSFGLVGDAGVPLPFAPARRRLRVLSSRGGRVATGAMCELRVLPVRAGGFNCLLRVQCDGVILYPNEDQTAGYVPCDVADGEARAARDSGATHQDGDPLVDYDLAAAQVTVEDFGPRTEAPFRVTLGFASPASYPLL